MNYARIEISWSTVPGLVSQVIFDWPPGVFFVIIEFLGSKMSTPAPVVCVVCYDSTVLLDTAAAGCTHPAAVCTACLRKTVGAVCPMCRNPLRAFLARPRAAGSGSGSASGSARGAPARAPARAPAPGQSELGALRNALKDIKRMEKAEAKAAGRGTKRPRAGARDPGTEVRSALKRVKAFEKEEARELAMNLKAIKQLETRPGGSSSSSSSSSSSITYICTETYYFE